MKTKIVSIDLQNDFTAEGGICYRSRPAVEFIKNSIIPFVAEKNIKIAEIISDYRQPRPGDRGDCCHPGEWGYKSEIPNSVKENNVWIKCMNSPLWIRDNIGDATKQPGLPYQDPQAFSNWINTVVGRPEDTQILLIGLTLDCCVLCTAQEFNFRGFTVKILKEGVDAYSGDREEKEMLCKIPVENWAEVVIWDQVKETI